MGRFDGGDGRRVAAKITITVWSDGAMSIEGPTNDPTWCLVALEHAREAIRNQVVAREGLVIPAKDTEIPVVSPDPLYGGL